jgi:hypothetical protein
MEEEAEGRVTTIIPQRKQKKKKCQQLQHAWVCFNPHKSDFYTQSAIYTRRVWFSRTHKCNFDTYDTHECDFNTHKIGVYTQSKISTRRVWFSTQSVILHAECAAYTHENKFDTYASEYDTHECDFYSLELWFLHAEFNFYMECAFGKHECDSNTHEWDFNTHKIDFYTHGTISTGRVWFYMQSVLSTHTRVISTCVRVNMTLISVIRTRMSVIYTHRV